jgi:hypothetical protein
MQASHSCTLAYCRPIHLISIEFQNIHNNPVTLQKNFFSPVNCYYPAIREVTLTEVFSKNYWDIKIQDLIVDSRKKLFHFVFILHANKYIFEA